MKCEICGEQISVLGVFEARLCDKHAEQVRDYIKSLKPKVTVCQYPEGYDISEGGVVDTFVSRDAAEALYNYMRRERER